MKQWIMPDLDAAFAGVIADIFEAEADHWEAEYELQARRYGSGSPTKAAAAWKLGSAVLRRRASEYRSGTVRMTRIEAVDHD